MRSALLLVVWLLMNSCANKAIDKKRHIASASIQEATLSEYLDDKLESLHIYYLIGHKNLDIFDSQIKDLDTNKLYESEAYLKLIAVRTQVEEIEHELIHLWNSASGNQKSSVKLMMNVKFLEFSNKSNLRANSLENIMHSIGGDISSQNRNEKMDEVISETKEYEIHEKNIEHLSQKLNLRVDVNAQKIYPSSDRAGNITGNEFPAKVWALTFDDGPGRDSSQTILNNLKTKQLKATFFQLTQKVKENPIMGKAIKDAEMEIASHSYTHLQLTKVGEPELEREITQAVLDIEKLQGVKMKFFRLPYGAGVNSPHIRNKIVKNNLIHVFWNIDTLDWMVQSPDKIVERAISLMKKTPRDAGVILFHDIHKRTAEASPLIMDYLKKDSRRVCTLGEIVTQMNEEAPTVCPSK